jgi:integrase
MSRRGRVWQRGRKKGEPALRGVPWYYVVDVESGGKRQQMWKGGFRTQDEAQTRLDEFLESVRRGEYVPPTTTTFGTYMKDWLNSLDAAGRRSTTIDRYRLFVDAYVVPALGGIEIQSLTPVDLDRLYADLLVDGRRNRKGGLSKRTVRLVHSIIGKALSDAERKGMVRRNVARLATPPSATSTRAPEMKVWLPSQLRQFLDATGTFHHGALFRLAAMTGLRRGEMCGLRWEDMDLDAGELRVRQSVITVSGKPQFDSVKSARSRRTISVDPRTIAVLRRHRQTQLEQRVAVGAGYTDRSLVFAMPDGRPWNPDTISQAFDREAARAELSRIRFHDLRHTHATHLLTAGANVKVVSERLGHASVSFTLDTYGHVLPGQQADAAAAVAQLVDAL